MQMFVCVYVCVIQISKYCMRKTYIFVFNVCACTHTEVETSTHYILLYTNKCVSVCIDIYTRIIYIYMYMCVYVCLYIYIYI